MTKAKEIRKELCEHYQGADTLRSPNFEWKGLAIEWLIAHFSCTYSTAYYLATEARMTPYIFDHKGGLFQQ